MSSVREEMSRVRREIICLGGEWDITWSLPKLHRELDDLKSKCTSRFVRSAPQSKAIIRHYILYLTLDRLTMYERDLLPGLCKVRLTTICPTSSRFPISEESKFAFKPGLTIHRENAGFKISIPLVAGSPCPKNQLKEWKIEFEVLHRFPAAPIYGVVARGWTDPWTLTHAKSIDLPSPDVPPPYVDFTGQEINPFHLKPIARIDFVENHTKSVFNIHVWRATVRAIIFTHRLVRQTKQTKRSNLEKLERDIRLLNARNSGEKEIMQMDLMMRTIGVMNEFLVAGAAGKLGQAGASGTNASSWLSSWVPSAPTGAPQGTDTSSQPPPVDLTHIEKQIDALREAVESVQKTLHESGGRDRHSSPAAPKSVADLLANRRESVSRGSVLTRAVHAHAPDVSATPSRTESMISTPLDPTEPAESVPESPTSVGATVGALAGSWTDAVNAWWGAPQSAPVVTEPPPPPRVPKKSVKKPTVKAPEPVEEAPDEEEEKAEEVPAAPPVIKVPTSPKKALSIKKLPPAKSVPPVSPKKVAAAKPKPKPKPPQDPAKAKAELIVKLKVLEAKRKAEIQKREEELASFSKKLPPVDRYKFPGMPGPPPFKPKKAEADPSSLLPSALAVGEEDDGEDEQEET